MKKAIVLSSGGVDSTTCVSQAIEDVGKENVLTVSVWYGQKHSKELTCANNIAQYYGLSHRVIDLTHTGIMNGSKCTLLQGNDKIPEGEYSEQIDKTSDGMVSTYVPFRNGLILSSVAAMAMSLYPNDEVDIYLGVHADDIAGNAYADCSKEFTDSIGLAISIGTYNKVHLKTPLVNFTKAEVVKLGLSLGTPYKLTWSCYNGDNKPCGKCGTCIDRQKAFKANGIKDPALEE